MNRKKAAKTGLIVLLGTGFLFPATCCNSKKTEIDVKNPVARKDDNSSLDIAMELEIGKLNRSDILTIEYVCDLMEDYVKKVAKDSKEFQLNIRMYGWEDVVKSYQSSQLVCYKQAKKIVSSRRDIVTEEERHKVGEELRKIQRKYSGAYIDYDGGKVIDTHEKYAELLVNHFARLLKQGDNHTNIRQLVQDAYTKQEYEEYCRKQVEAATEMYEAIRSSRSLIVDIFLQKARLDEEINSLKKHCGEKYKKSIEDFFPGE